MKKRIVSGIMLTLVLLSMLTLALSILPSEANPVYPGEVFLTREDIDVTISHNGSVVQARVDGTYTFVTLGSSYPYGITMFYPVPPNASNISVKIGETTLDWEWASDWHETHYNTIIGDYPFIEWWIEPVPASFTIKTYYEHTVPLIDGQYQFLYAMGTGRYLADAKDCEAYVRTYVSKDVAPTQSYLEAYLVTEEGDLEPATYEIASLDGMWNLTYHVTWWWYWNQDFLVTITPATEPRTWTVDDDGPADYHIIQEAINAAYSGDTIFVYSGTYYENVVVNKTVTLVGENKSTTVIDGNETFVSIVDIVANNVTLRGFTIQNDMSDDWLAGGGICINNLSGTIIIDNIVTNTQYGINVWNSTGNTITSNNIANNYVGIQFQFFSTNNTINGNNITNNDYGVRTDWSPNNRFYHNNLMGNYFQVYRGGVLFSPNIWDIGYPHGGNYWDDYSGTDFYSGPHQNETGSDGIGDSAYEVTFSNTIPKISLYDDYPLMGMFSNFNAFLGYYVNFISNSTVEDFEYFESNSTIRIRVSNMTTDQTHGFCRLSIPHDIIAPQYTITINGDPVSYTTIFENDTLSIIYFSYEHSTLEIIISPRFPLADATPIITMLAPENETYTAKDVSLTFTVSETTSWIGYSLDNQANVTISGNTTIANLSDGSHSMIVYANDTAGNMGSSGIVHFTIETQQTAVPWQIWIIVAIVIIVVAGTIFLIYFTKIKRTTERVKQSNVKYLSMHVL